MTIFEASFWENAWKDMNEWGKNNEIAFNQFIDLIKPLKKYDENKLKQAWNKSWDKMNAQNTEELLSKITDKTATIIENKIKSSEIKNQEDFKQTMDELMKSSIEKMMQENLKKVMVEAFQEVIEEKTIDEENTVDDSMLDELLAKHEGLVYSSQQKIFDTNENTNNDYYYEGNL